MVGLRVHPHTIAQFEYRNDKFDHQGGSVKVLLMLFSNMQTRKPGLYFGAVRMQGWPTDLLTESGIAIVVVRRCLDLDYCNAIL